MAKRTTHRSSAGKKLYAVRNADGSFKDIQQYDNAHRADLAASSTAERAGKKKGKKKAAKKAAKKAGKKTAKKAAKKK
jgi:ribosomal protein L18